MTFDLETSGLNVSNINNNKLNEHLNELKKDINDKDINIDI